MIFPADPFKPSKVDPEYDAEARFFAQNGMSIAVWNMDEPEKAPKISNPEGMAYALWRGWMLNACAFSNLAAHLDGMGIAHGLHEQRKVHFARQWTHAFAHVVPTTSLVSYDQLDWDGLVAKHGVPLFVKDEVKSSSMVVPCASESDLHRVMRSIVDHRGVEEGDWVVRSWLDLDASVPEIRRWCIDGVWFGSEADAPYLESMQSTCDHVEKRCAERWPSTWMVADYARDVDGRWWLIEVGDAMVSGWKEWTMADAQNVLEAMAARLSKVASYESPRC